MSCQECKTWEEVEVIITGTIGKPSASFVSRSLSLVCNFCIPVQDYTQKEQSSLPVMSCQYISMAARLASSSQRKQQRPTWV